MIAVALFLGCLFFFRSLAPVLIIFVIFERGLGYAADQLTKHTKVNRKGAIAGLLLLLGAGVGAVVWLGVTKIIEFVELARTDGARWVESLTQSTLIQKLRDRLGIDSHVLTEHAKSYALQAFHYLTATAYVALFVFVGFILAVMYLFERDEIDEWMSGIAPRTIVGTMSRWLGYVADAIAITVRLQIVVAIFNAVFTLPLLLLLGLPNVPLLFLLVLVSGMVPVVGGAFSGLVLCLVAYDAKGVVGVGVFLGVTFILGKVESYYLSPRLTAQHVKLPGLVLVVALLMFETIFGFYGLFLSFPALYVASRISWEWREEEAAINARGGTLSMPPPSSRSVPSPAPSSTAPSTSTPLPASRPAPTSTPPPDVISS
jgi:predicted PurR-regulated permease PerM